MKRILSLVITMMMAVTMMPYMAFAEAVTEDVDIELVPNAVSANTAIDHSAYRQNIGAAADDLRTQMSHRIASPEVKLKLNEFDKDYISASINEIFETALEHTGVPNEGDYLRWSVKSYKCNVSAKKSNGIYYADYKYEITYYTGSEQEDKLAEAISKLTDSLHIEDKSDYEKVKAIYDYMTANISYDYTNLKNEAYTLKYSAYAALMNKTAVCQGYATLFYRLALAEGIDTRVIAGQSKNVSGVYEHHAWNIVKIDGKYYNLDATWDSTWDKDKKKHDFFLKGTDSFTNHEPDSMYTTGEFQCLYPINKTDYKKTADSDDDQDADIPGSQEHEVVIDKEVKASFNKPGKTEGSHCSKCNTILVAQKDIPAITSVKLEKTKNIYTGKAIKPKAVLKDSQGNTLKQGSDYVIDYSKGITKVGKYTAKIILLGKYDGNKSLSFYILPKAPTSLSTQLYGYDDVKLSWSKSTGANGYYVYYKKSTDKEYKQKRVTGTSIKLSDLYDGVKYDFKVAPYCNIETSQISPSYKTSSIYTLKKLSTPKVVKSGTKVKVSWKNISGETGYQISKSTKKNVIKIVSTYKTTKGTYKTLTAKKGTKYYYKVRAYKSYKVGSKTVKVYGPWSAYKAYKR